MKAKVSLVFFVTESFHEYYYFVYGNDFSSNVFSVYNIISMYNKLLRLQWQWNAPMNSLVTLQGINIVRKYFTKSWFIGLGNFRVHSMGDFSLLFQRNLIGPLYSFAKISFWPESLKDSFMGKSIQTFVINISGGTWKNEDDLWGFVIIELLLNLFGDARWIYFNPYSWPWCKAVTGPITAFHIP